MAKKLFLHIGHYKTGTTALQVFFARNHAAFVERGLDYAALRRHNAKHSAFAFALLHAAGARTLMHGYADPTPPEDLWAELFEYVRASHTPDVLISSEEFMRLAAFPAAVERLADILARRGAGIDIEVIAYLRAPQSHLRSWFNQLVKMGQPVPDYASALQGAIEPVHIDYGFALAPWVAMVGAEKVILRSYAPRKADPAFIFRDVLTALGRSLPEGLNLPEGDPNPRLDDRVLDLVRVLQNSGHGGKMVDFLREQAQRYFDAQDAAGPMQPPALDAVRTQAAAGVAALAELPRSNLDLDALGADLPAADPAGRLADVELLGFVLAELVSLRRRVNNRPGLQAIERRLARLEAALGKAS